MIVIKDFDSWNEKKKEIDAEPTASFYHEREVWWCSLGVNIGSEQDGTGKSFDRPVLILRGFNKEIFLGVALTGKRKTGKYYFYLGIINGKDATAILSQIRLIDTRRLVRKITTIDNGVFSSIKGVLRDTLFPLK